MTTRLSFANIGLFVLLMLSASERSALGQSAGQIVVSAKIEDTCRSLGQVTTRKTIAYIDLASIRADDNDWGLTLLNKLNLAPREVLIVLAVNPFDLTVREVFNLCWPKYTDDELKTAKQNMSVWAWLVSPDPYDQQKENLETFDNRLRQALEYVRTSQLKKEDEQGKKNFLAAISLDKDRFNDPKEYRRIIVYSDAALDDPLVKLNDPAQAVASLSKNYPINFKYSEISVFGVRADNALTTDVMEKVFRGYFVTGAGYLESFSFALPEQSNSLSSQVAHYEGDYSGGGAAGAAELVFAVVDNKTLVNAWVRFSAPQGALYIPIDGEYGCDSSGCNITATILTSIPEFGDRPFFRKGDRVQLKGTADGWSGELQSLSHEVFEGLKDEVKYQIHLTNGTK